MCEYKGYEIYQIYKDSGISAKTGNKRPAFEKLLQDIKDKKCNTIVVLKLDRLTRSVYDWETILKFLEENEAYLDCANYDITGIEVCTPMTRKEVEHYLERLKAKYPINYREIKKEKYNENKFCLNYEIEEINMSHLK